MQSNIISKASFINYNGGAGARALVAFIRDAEEFNDTIMVQSTPLLFRKMSGVYPKGFRDLTPICSIIVEYQVIAVKYDSPFQTAHDFIDAVKADPARHTVWGGSTKGSLDHTAAAMILKAGGADISMFRYGLEKVGLSSIDVLLTGRASAIVAGYGEVLKFLEAGQIRILGITSDKRLPDSNIPTLREQGIDVVFANWRGFFARPDTPDTLRTEYIELFRRLTATPEWTETREKYGWLHFFKAGEEFNHFLESQEKELSEILEELE